jgi:hypothetical protein
MKIILFSLRPQTFTWGWEYSLCNKKVSMKPERRIYIIIALSDETNYKLICTQIINYIDMMNEG